jgi:hypothetical protein
MSDDTPGDKKPKPIFNPDDVVEPDAVVADSKTGEVVDPIPADVAVKEPAVAKPARKPKADKSDKPAAAAGGATGEVAPASSGSDFAGREVVYVQAPIPPRLRGNRGLGSLLAVLGAVLFAFLFAAAIVASFFLQGQKDPMGIFAQFIQNSFFWVPVLVFLLAFVLLVLVVNRAGWAAHVFGSLLVALVVYFGSIGILLLVANIGAAASGDDSPATFGNLATNPIIIIAALVAREVAIWIGLAISARGRRVKARNLELVDEWEREHADTKAQYEQAGQAG